MSHPLDGDGVSAHLFQYLAKENRRMESARVFIPHTVIFENGFAAAWYYSSSQMEVKKRTAGGGGSSGKTSSSGSSSASIPLQDVYSEFAGTLESSDPAYNDTVVAEFIELPSASQKVAAAAAAEQESNNSSSFSVSNSISGSPQNARKKAKPKPAEPSVICGYLTRLELKEFLFSSGQKPRGLLQKFELPKGWFNTVILTTWSPKLTMSEATRSPYALADTSKSSSERCATLENTRDSVSVTLTVSVTAAVRQACHLLVQHLQQVEPIRVTGLIAKFKVSRSNKVVLLHTTGVRCAPTNSLAGEKVDRPLNLKARFVSRDDDELEKEFREHMKLYGGQQKPAKLAPLVFPSGQSSPSPTQQQSHATVSRFVTPKVIANVCKILGSNRWIPTSSMSPVRFDLEAEQEKMRQDEERTKVTKLNQEDLNQPSLVIDDDDDDDHDEKKDEPKPSPKSGKQSPVAKKSAASPKASVASPKGSRSPKKMPNSSPKNKKSSPKPSPTAASTQPRDDDEDDGTTTATSTPPPLASTSPPPPPPPPPHVPHDSLVDCLVDLVYDLESTVASSTFGRGEFEKLVVFHGNAVAAEADRAAIVSTLKSFDPRILLLVSNKGNEEGEEDGERNQKQKLPEYSELCSILQQRHSSEWSHWPKDDLAEIPSSSSQHDDWAAALAQRLESSSSSPQSTDDEEKEVKTLFILSLACGKADKFRRQLADAHVRLRKWTSDI